MCFRMTITAGTTIRLAHICPGIVNQDVHVTKPRQDFALQPAHVVFIADVSLESRHLRMVRRRIGRGNIPRYQSKVRAIGSKRLSNGLSEAPARPGNNGDAAGERLRCIRVHRNGSYHDNNSIVDAAEPTRCPIGVVDRL